ncbi:hypothetical protein [Micromonospora rhizosphaerae]|uniref:hypothetical protein n=1 Tax=Micromonospora rhizosphaerae TaxID=568872 RepID=UPI00114C96F8|nr:hypothetical protein [Micromonospora rhizosphaerae]
MHKAARIASERYKIKVRPIVIDARKKDSASKLKPPQDKLNRGERRTARQDQERPTAWADAILAIESLTSRQIQELIRREEESVTGRFPAPACMCAGRAPVHPLGGEAMTSTKRSSPSAAPSSADADSNAKRGDVAVRTPYPLDLRAVGHSLAAAR